METITKDSPLWKSIFRGPDPSGCERRPERTDCLFAEGDLSALCDTSRPKVLVIGCRDAGGQHLSAIPVLMRHLAANPARPVIVTGLAAGTDTAVTEAALSLELATVAVLPSPLDLIYPASNRGLARRLASKPGCALLSQFPTGTEPSALTILGRNSTKALLSDAAILTSSRSRGGATDAARMTDRLSRPIYAVPGGPDDSRSEGCNRLIAEGRAKLLDYHNCALLEDIRSNGHDTNPKD